MSNKDNYNKFFKELQADQKRVLSTVNSKIKATAEAVHESLFSPKASGGVNKETGHLRANYIVSVDSQRDGVVGSRDSVDTSVRDSQWAMFLGLDDLHTHTNIFFNNDVEYGPMVNFGTDRINPQNFKAKAVQAGNEYIKANGRK